MYKLATYIAVTAFSFFLCVEVASGATAEPFCAVTLHVVGSDATPITSTWIELDDPSGKVVLKEMMQGPTWRICDFGFGPHVLRVGTNECLPVAISNIRLVFGSPLSLNVVLDSCGYRETMGTGCLLYLRVVDDNGKPVADAEFSPRITKSPAPRMDSYGRYQVRFVGSHDLAFTAPGFDAATTHVDCKETKEVDQLLVMRRTQ